MRLRNYGVILMVIAAVIVLDLLFRVVLFVVGQRTIAEKVFIPSTSPKGEPRDEECTFHTCFGVYQCGHGDVTRISVYVYPTTEYVNETGENVAPVVSREFGEILETVVSSEYYTSDPERACLFIPHVDVLNQGNINTDDVSRILTAQPSWTDGSNHLLFNMLPGGPPEFNSTLDVNMDKAILAGGGFHKTSYRGGYDVSIPIYNPMTAKLVLPNKTDESERRYLLVAAQIGYHKEFREELVKLEAEHRELLVLGKCAGNHNVTIRCIGSTVFRYPQILQDADFCMVIRGARLAQTALFDALKTGCIPIIVADGYILPFSDVLDWKRAAVVVPESLIGDIMSIVNNISRTHVLSMRRQGSFYFRKYFSSMSVITMTTLQIINDRIFPYASRKYSDWNEDPKQPGTHTPLFLPLHSSSDGGFTAVVLTYDRQESLFRILRQLNEVPSLVKIIVVWNNQFKLPPAGAQLPRLGVEVTFVQTRENRLSNRFYPFDQITTECILALDDDIVMLTADEIEFGYQVWREFPDRLVGFPSRGHKWTDRNGYKYVSEWGSNFSMILTGAAFHHKYYNYLYTYSQPGNIKEYVDEYMNCEDIAMNFLVTHITGKPPIKVSPKQRFKCSDCKFRYKRDLPVSERRGHLDHRSECIQRFTKVYGQLHLKTVEFRADPVLYRDKLPHQVLRYRNLGST